MAAENEFENRYRELLAGPWAARAEKARSFVAARDPLRQPQLARTFAPHWKLIPDEPSMKIRDSFDFALGQLMLTELAIETGYVPLELVRDDVRKELSTLLWSDAARQYLMTYDYVPVRFLAARVGVDLGLPPVRPPAVNPNAETRFATFLSHHQVWSTDFLVETWLGFLDDYVAEYYEQVHFATYLKTGAATERQQERFAVLAAGAQRFVNALSSLFFMLEEDETPQFGLLYAYWIARFYGLRLGENGYVVRDVDWSAALRGAIVLQVKDPEVERARQAAMDENLEAIASAWRGIRNLVETHATSRS